MMQVILAVLLILIFAVLYAHYPKNAKKGARLAGQANANQPGDEILKQLKDPVNGTCPDPLFPYLNTELNKCVQCFPDSFNCLTGYQSCYLGMCVAKNSPQCAFYPHGALGFAQQNTEAARLAENQKKKASSK